MTHSLRSLAWLVDELDTSLGLAREALLGYRSDPEDPSQLSFALGYLHQVSGSLIMAQCYGAVLLAKEMEAALNMLLSASSASVKDTCEALELTMLALPNYVRDLLNGRDDTLAQLIEQVNELRAVRAEPLISSAAIFMPNMAGFDERVVAETSLLHGLTVVEKEMLGKLQKAFQFSLLGYLKQRETENNQEMIIAVLQRLQGTFNGRALEPLWRVASIFFMGLVENSIHQSAAPRQLLLELDKTLRCLVGVEKSELLSLQSRELLRNLLFYIALTPNNSAALSSIKKEFVLDQAFPSLVLSELDGVLQARLGDTVVTALSGALLDEIAQLVSSIDSSKGDDQANHSTSIEIKVTAERLATILMMVGQINLSQSLSEVVGMVDPAMSSAVALDLSAVMTRLQSIQRSLQDWALHYADAPLASDLLAETAYVVDDAQRSLIREVRNNFESIKESIVGYIASQWDDKFLLEIPGQFEHIFGAVEVIGLKRVARIVEQLGNYITSHLLHSEQPPEWSDLDALADAITGFEYYLEAIDKGREGEQRDMLRLTAQAMEKLGFAVDLDSDTEQMTEQSVTKTVNDEVEPIPDVASLDSQDDDDEEIDPEIKEIFIEEAQEVLEELVTNYSPWLLDQSDQKLLGELRRGFHTLKGSGRMVKAHVIGDLAWAIESMLNKILEHSFSVVPETAKLLDLSLSVIPTLVRDFERGDQQFSSYCSSLIVAAEALAKGESVILPQEEEQGVGQENLEMFAVGISDLDSIDDNDTLAEFEGNIEVQPVVHIFVGEANAYIDTLANFLENFQQPHGDSRVAPADVQRALHTLQASAGMAGIAAVSNLASTLEDFLIALFARGQRVSAGIITLLMESVDRLRDTMTRLDAGDGEDSAGLNAYRSRIELARAQWQDDRAAGSALEGMAQIKQLMVAGLENVLLADTQLTEWSAQPSLSQEEVEPLIRELAELSVAAEDSGVSSLSILCDEFLLALGNLADVGQGIDSNTLSVFKSAHELMLNMMDLVAIGQPVSSIPAEMLAQLQAQTARVIVAEEQDIVAATEALEPAAQVPVSDDDLAFRMAGETYDSDILSFFLEEADDLIEDIENAMLAWRDTPNDVSQGEVLNRVLHTLKGGARLAGLSLLGDLSHDLEALILQKEGQLAEGEGAVFDVLFTRYDELVSVLDRVKSGGDVPPVEDVPTLEIETQPEPVFEPVEPLETQVKREAIDSEAVEIALPEPVSPEVVLSSASNPVGDLPLATMPAPAPSTAQPRPAVAIQESVKIPAQVLDDLVNLAGEASIARGRVEQGVGESASALNEMEETISRLRNQVRQLGRQTEAQIQFRREQIESSESAGFDPLELDRYSQLQELSRGLEESGSDLQDLKNTLLEKSQAVEGLLLMQSRITQDLQENLMKTRLVPFSRLVPRLRRIVRQVGQELGKQVNLGLNNIEGEMDRTVLEKIITPIEHMLRNAMDHGIETAKERLAAGKPGEGNIFLSFQREGGEVVITVADDGKGLDVIAIREKAVSKKLIAPDTQATDSELLRLIFQPGFTTATTVSQVSGRGVGMDVVKTEVHQLGGSISIESVLGQGVEFTIRLPFTVSVNKALLVKGGESIYALPLGSIVGVTQLDSGDVNDFYTQPDKRLEYAGFDYKVCPFGSLLNSVQEASVTTSGKAVLVLVEVDSHRYAVHVDAIEGHQEIIIKGLGAQFTNVPGVAGATILASGKVVVILDLPSLLRLVGERSILEGPEQTGALLGGGSFDIGAVDAGAKTIMVVDDSVTVRKVTSRVLEREGFIVATAKDGVEATEILAQVKPDLMLLDIEMPRMDGFEVARVVRSSKEFSELPIIMISSRTGEKHQQRARDLGVNEFLGKPYQEDQLLNLLDELLDFGFV